jgi:hypothetical protein
MTTTRHNNKWRVSEVLALQREYELLEWTINEIAAKHGRSVRAILFKLQSESFITSWEDARGFDSQIYQKDFVTKDILTPSLSDISEEENYFSEPSEPSIPSVQENLTTLSTRISSLEYSINNINITLAKLFAHIAENQFNSVAV